MRFRNSISVFSITAITGADSNGIYYCISRQKAFACHEIQAFRSMFSSVNTKHDNFLSQLMKNTVERQVEEVR